MKLTQLTLMVTGDCNMDCPDCSQGPWRKAFRNYHMSLREIERLAERATEQRLAPFSAVHVAGGEPTRWRYFSAGCAAIKDYGMARSVVVSSNCVDSELLLSALDYGSADRIYTQMSNASRRGVTEIKRKHRTKIYVGRREVHKPHPTRPQFGVLPARCGCFRFAYFAGRLYQCANVWPHFKRLGLDPDDSDAWCRVDDDWSSFFKGLDPLRSPACTVCLANRKVWEKV